MILEKFYSLFLILIQLFALLVTSLGAAYWIQRACSQRFSVKSIALLCGAGLAATVVALQIFVYLDVRLGICAWVAFFVTAIGFAFAARRFLLIKSTFQKRHWNHLYALVTIFLVVFSIQGAGLLYWGPARYYAAGHTDLPNYMMEAQFYMDKKFSSAPESVGLQPYLAVAITLKKQRNGAAVADGYLAVITGGDAQLAYGTLSTFFICLLGCCLFELMRSFGVSTALSLLGGVWAACLPCITKIHLENFFSQEAVLFLFPAFACLFRNFSYSPLSIFIIAAILLAYLLGTYTELFVFGLMFSLFLSVHYIAGPVYRKIIFALGVISASLLADPFCTKLMWLFVRQQYQVAARGQADLEAIFPFSGTWYGWTQSLFGYEHLRTMQFYNIITLGLVIASLSAFFSRQVRKRLELLGIIAPYFLTLIWLISKPVFLKYPFAKIYDSFAPLTLMLFIIGANRLALLFAEAGNRFLLRRTICSYFTPACLFPLFILSLLGTFCEMKHVIREAVVNGELCTQIYHGLRHSKNKTFVITEDNPAITSWMAYHGRNNNLYLVSAMSCNTISYGWMFLNVPYEDPLLNVVTPSGIFLAGDLPPKIKIDNPQGVDSAGGAIWYWIGEKCFVQIMCIGGSQGKSEFFFHATAGEANKSPVRTINFAALDGRGAPVTRSFETQADISFPLVLNPGINRFQLTVTAPGVTAPGDISARDPRVLLLRVENFQVWKTDPWK